MNELRLSLPAASPHQQRSRGRESARASAPNDQRRLTSAGAGQGREAPTRWGNAPQALAPAEPVWQTVAGCAVAWAVFLTLCWML